jgi:DNA-binding MarR family transcriptional regulator
MNDSAVATENTLTSASPAGPTDQSIFALLGAAHALEARVEDALGRAGLSGPKYAVLNELVAAGKPLSLSELAGKLSCVKSNMTQLVDRLETEGLVRRVSCPGDRRLVKAEITDAGGERQRDGATEIARLHVEFAAKVGAEDRAALERLLSALQ